MKTDTRRFRATTWPQTASIRWTSPPRCWARTGGRYGYENIEVGTIDTWGYSIEYVMSNFWWGPPDEAAEIFIAGDDFSGTLPRSGSYEWYSDAEAWAWRSFYQTFNIPAGGANTPTTSCRLTTI